MLGHGMCKPENAHPGVAAGVRQEGWMERLIECATQHIFVEIYAVEADERRWRPAVDKLPDGLHHLVKRQWSGLNGARADARNVNGSW